MQCNNRHLENYFSQQNLLTGKGNFSQFCLMNHFTGTLHDY